MMGESHDNRSCFFKLIFKGHNTEQLQIPPKFEKYLPKELPEQAILRGSTGDEWRVKLCKTADGIYLQDGWKHYFEDHSLGGNEFLLFKYNGELCFDVIIFGKDGCERVYGSLIRTNHETASSSGAGRPRKTSLRSHLLHESKPSKDTPERSKVSKMAESFASDFPYFKSCMAKYNVDKVFILTLPALFAREHLPQCTTTIVLRNSEDRSWKVKYVSTEKSYALSQGWAVFVRDNKLKIGDICIFELLAKKEIRVHIFRRPRIELTCKRA
ncbi:B3 domain-containing protein Os01g0723500-like isoform X1 [Corylus avellana]|uniref:B3 domain-containing protein Os01g0723500-like isoform X1 n=1 Tax=Corylus avellana TaxID=13451 RepID=UPI001E2230DC|nr:B3 domain-containing protein Os01g0723500-like isoform X1 [Corylus avellana]